MRASTCTRFVVAVACGSGLCAQSYDDLTFVRNRPSAYSSVFKARAGFTSDFASDPNPAFGLEDNYGFDGSLYFHDDEFTSQKAVLDVYAGRDGGYIGVREGNPGGAVNRMEITARYFPFYREGFYQGDDYIPTGRYEGKDFGIYIGVGTQPAAGVTIETGPFYRRNTFHRNANTDPSYVIPSDYNAYGIKFYLEQTTLQLDRTYGLPYDGYIGTVLIERELNDEDKSFGSPVWMGELPRAVWRARAALEWYFPAGELGVWGLQAKGSYTDKNDRVYNYDAQKQVGELWFDGAFSFRFQLGPLGITPRVTGQYVKSLEENGISRNSNLFYGGGVHAQLELSELMFYADYSYSSNQSRPPVSAQEDTFGEQWLFAGVEVRFGARRQ